MEVKCPRGSKTTRLSVVSSPRILTTTTTTPPHHHHKNFNHFALVSSDILYYFVCTDHRIKISIRSKLLLLLPTKWRRRQHLMHLSVTPTNYYDYAMNSDDLHQQARTDLDCVYIYDTETSVCGSISMDDDERVRMAANPSCC